MPDVTQPGSSRAGVGTPAGWLHSPCSQALTRAASGLVGGSVVPLSSRLVLVWLHKLFPDGAKAHVGPDSHPNAGTGSSGADCLRLLLVSPADPFSHPSSHAPALHSSAGVTVTPALWKAGGFVLPAQLSLCNVRRGDTGQRFLESVQRSLRVGSSWLGPDHCSK